MGYKEQKLTLSLKNKKQKKKFLLNIFIKDIRYLKELLEQLEDQIQSHTTRNNVLS